MKKTNIPKGFVRITVRNSRYDANILLIDGVMKTKKAGELISWLIGNKNFKGLKQKADDSQTEN